MSERNSKRGWRTDSSPDLLGGDDLGPTSQGTVRARPNTLDPGMSKDHPQLGLPVSREGPLVRFEPNRNRPVEVIFDLKSAALLYSLECIHRLFFQRTGLVSGL
ncbi:hypothetical protein POX_a00411 [Penicillium oxalicum]|uniref:hypothetical protein n=1 Tax=Penicillium oxalicum TaxID=69781 RepID=UPI0020B8E657|nr:hypothetical protein POX_a00411 [Penicillium oxalicum]KAI2793824.1 hypothetical protein POX_a00411 [Penicillium oxalicum]